MYGGNRDLFGFEFVFKGLLSGVLWVVDELVEGGFFYLGKVMSLCACVYVFLSVFLCVMSIWVCVFVSIFRCVYVYFFLIICIFVSVCVYVCVCVYFL